MRLTESIRKATTGVVRRTVERGPRHACGWILHHLHERYREWSFGADTAEFGSWRGSLDRADCHPYEPLAYACIERALRQAVDDPRKEVFLDYGSGKGRALMVAAQLPFRRVIGVELVPELCEIARKNIERAWPRLSCPKVEVHCADATEFVVPPDVTLIYLYNPFWDGVLSAVQNRIRESLDKRPRRLHVVYLLNRGQTDGFAECAWLRPTIPRRELWENVELVVYESVQNAANHGLANTEPADLFTAAGFQGTHADSDTESQLCNTTQTDR